MHGPRTARINAILGKRRAPAQQLKRTADRLDACRQAVAELEQLRGYLATDAPREVSERVGRLRLGEFDGWLATLAATVRRLHTRFGRETLSIGVVGQAGQGKSSLLKALTGLGEAEIPTSGSKHCTGVACSFVNRDGPVGGEVTFHDEAGLLREVISLYYDREKGMDLGRAPTSLGAFQAQPLPPLPDARKNNARDLTCYDHLRQYQTYLDGYRGWLADSHRSRTIGRDEIRRFVAQVDENGRALLAWMAVREARITCPFPAKDVGPVTFVDTPGLGNTGTGDMERIFHTLQDRVDFVVFVRLPKGVDRGWQPLDLELYDKASQALAPLPLQDCSLMVINRTRPGTENGDNSENCRVFADEMAGKNIRVTRQVTVDCQDSAKATQEILDWTVDYLASRIEDIDRVYLAATNAELARLHQELSTELDRAAEALGSGRPRSEESKVFRPLFKSFWDDLTGKLEGLVKKLQNQRDKESDVLRRAVHDAQTAAETVVMPSTDEINQRANAAGSLDRAYYSFMNEYRASLSRHFLSLDEGLKQGIHQVKECVANELAATILGNLTQERGPRFLARLRQETTFHGHRLAAAFDWFIDFDLSYRGLIQHRIRKHLDDLTPDLTPLKLPQGPNTAQLRSSLETAYREAVYNIGQSLQDILVEPSQAAFAVVEEFVDAVLRAEGAEDEWYFVIEDLRADLWKAAFDALGERSRRRQQWQAAIDRVRELARPETFRIGS